jgi:hypothetical protein
VASNDERLPQGPIGRRFVPLALARSGGMGRVYRARDLSDGSTVALKVLVARGSRDVARFEQEAALLSALVHPAIVRYVAHGKGEHGEDFLAMEWLEGETLAERLGRGARLDLGETMALAERAAGALSVAHARGVVHRDIKPSNVFLVGGRAAEAKVLDFGIARIGPALTSASGRMLGSPGYMSPEQARGGRTLDARSDVFALGCVLFECLAGRPAFAGDHLMAVLARILVEDPPPLRDLSPEVPAEVEALVRRMLAKAPSARPHDGTELLRDIAAARNRALGSDAGAAGQAIGTTEQRQLTVVVLADAASLAAAEAPARSAAHGMVDAPSFVEDPRRWRELGAVVARFGATVGALGTDAALIACASGETADDRARSAASCALAVRQLHPAAPMAVASGLGLLESEVPTGAVLERAGQLLSDEVVRWRARAEAADETTMGFEVQLPVPVDAETDELLDGAFEVARERGQLLLRGHHHHDVRARAARGGGLPLAGRERELRALESLVDECLEEPVTRVELVVAAPGMGKTRLALAALDAARVRHPSLHVWWLRGDAVHTTPFATMGPGLRAAAGVAPAAPAVRALLGEGGTPASGRPALDAQRHQLAAHLARYLGGADLPRTAAFIGEVAGVKNPLGENAELAAALLDPAQMGGRIVAAWQCYLAAYCAAHPLVIVLDDAQWADHASLSLLDAGLAALPRLPLLVLALARPEVHALHPALWKERAFEELRLGELSPRAAAQLLTDALGPRAPADEAERLVALGRGNPRTLLSLAGRDGEPAVAVVTRAPQAAALALAVATLERLPPLPRRALRALAVLGGPAPPGAVRHLLGDRREDAGSAVEDALQAGVDASLLQALGGAGRPKLFGFRDALLERAAYATLTEADARIGHRLAAGWLAGHGGDAAQIAMHLEHGGAAAQALHERVRAGDAALGADDQAEAGRQVEASTRLLASPGLSLASVGALRVLEAEVQRVAAAYLVARRAAEEAMAVLPRGGEPWLRAAREVAASCVRLGDDQRLQALAAELSSMPAEALASASAACALLGICADLWHAALPAASQQCAAHFGLVMAAAARVDAGAAAAAEEVRAARALFGGEPHRALGHARSALAVRRAGNAARAARRAAMLEARALAALGDAGAVPALEAVIVEAAARRDAEARSCAAATLALWQLEHHGAALAWPHLEEALDRAVEQGDRRTEARVRCGLARVLAPQGQPRGAVVHAERALAIIAAPAQQAVALATLARIHTHAGAAELALASAGRAAALLESASDQLGEVEATVRLVWAEALHGAGRRAEAHAVIANARARLLERAVRIDEPAWRQTFLHGVPEHARTLELAQTWPS